MILQSGLLSAWARFLPRESQNFRALSRAKKISQSHSGTFPPTPTPPPPELQDQARSGRSLTLSLHRPEWPRESRSDFRLQASTCTLCCREPVESRPLMNGCSMRFLLVLPRSQTRSVTMALPYTSQSPTMAPHIVRPSKTIKPSCFAMHDTRLSALRPQVVASFAVSSSWMC